MNRGIVLFAHGARGPEWALPLNRLADKVGAREAGVSVQTAYLEHMTPSLDAAIGNMREAGVTDVTVVPVFIAPGGHLKQDLPRIIDSIRSLHPSLVIRLAPPVGESEEVLNAMAHYASTAAHGSTTENKNAA